MLFHITTLAAWRDAIERGHYAPASLSSEGFIHLSTAEQWPRTAARFFRGQTGLVLLTLDRETLAHEVRLEPADGELFPHLYGALDPRDVVSVSDLVPDADGSLRIASDGAAPDERM